MERRTKMAIGDRVEFKSDGSFGWLIDLGDEIRKPLVRIQGKGRRRCPTIEYHFAPPSQEIERLRDEINENWSRAEKRKRRVGSHRPRAMPPLMSASELSRETGEEIL